MATFIQEVLGLLAKKKTVNTLIKDKDYFELGRKRDSKLVTGGYSPEMDALAIKAEDLMCVMLSNTLQGGVNYVPIFSPPIPGSNCPKGPLVNSKLYQNPSTGTLEFKDDAKFEHGVIDTAGSYGTAGQVLTSTVTGVQWTTNGSGTVTSVDASGGTTGLTFSGGPVVSSGVLTLGGTLGVANGGTGLSQTPLQNQLLFGNASAGYSLVTLTGGTGISYNVSSGNLFITNTAPDQVVSITAGANVTVTGSYPNFTVAASAAATARKAYLGIQWRGATNPYFSIPFNSPAAAFLKAALISSTFFGLFTTHVKSVNEPSGTGTRIPAPPSFPSICGNIFVMAFAAPVVVGTILTAAALALRKSV
mgnify:CR=1 FL=1